MHLSISLTAPLSSVQIPDTDAAGNAIPAWKRQMLARKAAERAKAAAEEQRLKDLELQKIQSLPPWKRQLIARKEEEDAKRLVGRYGEDRARKDGAWRGQDTEKARQGWDIERIGY